MFEGEGRNVGNQMIALFYSKTGPVLFVCPMFLKKLEENDLKVGSCYIMITVRTFLRQGLKCNEEYFEN